MSVYQGSLSRSTDGEPPRNGERQATPPASTVTPLPTVRNESGEDRDFKIIYAADIAEEVRKIRVRELARQQANRTKAGGAPFPEFLGLDEFLAQEDEAVSQRIKGLWNTETPVLFTAQFKAGKTTARDNVVKCLADGGNLFDRYPVEPVTDGTIVVIDLELSPGMMRAWYRCHHIINQSRVKVVPMRGMAAAAESHHSRSPGQVGCQTPGTQRPCGHSGLPPARP
jgi:AAA domain